MEVQTPDEAFNETINVWNQYQAAVTFDMARNEAIAVNIINPNPVRQRIVNLNIQY